MTPSESVQVRSSESKWDQVSSSEISCIQWVHEIKSETKWHQASPSESKWDHIIQVRPSESKWDFVSPNEPKWDQVIPSEEVHWVHVSPSGIKRHKVSPCEINSDEVNPSETKWVQMSSSGTLSLPPILLANFRWHYRCIEGLPPLPPTSDS